MFEDRVVVIGGGNGGLSIAGRLRRAGVRNVSVIEPRTTHVFAPLQSHIAGGRARARDAMRPQAEVMPRGVEWVADAAASVDPQRRTVMLASGGERGYDHLIVSTGLRMRWDAVPGLAEAMATPAGVSNYDLALAQEASVALRDLRGGTAVFVQASDPASCAAAAQKPMYLACDWWRACGVLDDIRVVLLTPEDALFHVPEVDSELRRIADAYGIEVRTGAHPTSVDAAGQSVSFTQDRVGDTLDYDVLHVSPPQRPHDWLQASDLADASGFVDVDPETLRHRRHGSVWALGDAATLDTRPSGGAIRRQSAVLAKNLLAVLRGDAPTQRYDGYSVCPFTVSRNSVVFAEFDRTGRPRPSIPFWRGSLREHRVSWLMDRWVLPWIYWHMIVKGRA